MKVSVRSWELSEWDRRTVLPVVLRVDTTQRLLYHRSTEKTSFPDDVDIRSRNVYWVTDEDEYKVFNEHTAEGWLS